MTINAAAFRVAIDQLQTFLWIHHANCGRQGIRVDPVRRYNSDAAPAREGLSRSWVDNMRVTNRPDLDKLFRVSRS